MVKAKRDFKLHNRCYFVTLIRLVNNNIYLPYKRVTTGPLLHLLLRYLFRIEVTDSGFT